MKYNNLKSKIDTILLLVLLGVVAGRAQIYEAFPAGGLAGTATPVVGAGGTGAMLVFQALILACLGVWLIAHARDFSGRYTPLAGIFLLLLLAGGISISQARARDPFMFVHALNLFSLVILAGLLAQLLDQPWKFRLLLAVITATGVTAAYRCGEQRHYEIPELIRSFEENPDAVLRRQGLEPGSYNAELFKERIYSRDVTGFSYISNTQASWFILSSFAAMALILPGSRRLPAGQKWVLVIGLLLMHLQFVGLGLTRSKGGLAAFVLGSILLALLWFGREFFRRHWRASLIGGGALFLLGLAAIVGHGLHYGRLPTNSLWVRWQYWVATARMLRDHWFTGVGPGNFQYFYPRYMDPAAPEVISNPHSLPLQLWSEWGLFGLLALGFGLVAVAIRLARPGKIYCRLPIADRGLEKTGDWRPEAGGNPKSKIQNLKFLWAIFAAVLVTVILIIRGATSDLSNVTPGAQEAMILLTFAAPAAIWAAAFGAALLASRGWRQAPREQLSGILRLVLGVGLLAFIIHNLIDFAFFEPGVGTTFFALLALALGATGNPTSLKWRSNNPAVKVFSILAGITTLLIIFLIHIPAVRMVAANARTWADVADEYAELQHSQSYPQVSQVAEKLERLSAAPPLGPSWEPITEQLLHQAWELAPAQEKEPWQAKLKSFHRRRIEANPENFQNHLRFARCYTRLLEMRPELAGRYRPAAISQLEAALKLYPHNGAVLVEYAHLLQAAGRDANARVALRKALDAEAAYVRQQRQMYPGREPRPRMDLKLQEQARRLLDLW